MSGGALQIGEILDARYRITGLLGHGGMGSVYRAEHVAIHRPVAIKVLHPDFASDPDYGKRFRREAFVTGRAEHPNCVTVSDFGALAGGGFYLVMELVDGMVLGDVLLRIERMPARRALHIARHLLRGLGHAHAAGVVHRDVKPSNVILVRHGDDPDFAKLLDFGIAKLIDDRTAPPDAADQQITRIGTTVGTPSYVAPEQAVGGPPDPRSDLYSLSIVLYEMIAGRPPFRSDDMVKLLSMHLSARVPVMAELVPGLVVPPAVEDLVRTGLAKDRTQRYADAAEYIAAIDELLAGNLADPPEAASADASGSGGRLDADASGSGARLNAAMNGGGGQTVDASMPAAAVSTEGAKPGLSIPRWRERAAGWRERAARWREPAGWRERAARWREWAARGPSRRAVAGAAAMVAFTAFIFVVAYQNGDSGAVPGILAPVPSLAPVVATAAESGGEARAELALGHERMVADFPLEALEAYGRALILDSNLASDETLRENVVTLVRGRDVRLALMSVQVLGEADGDWALDLLVALASRDKRTPVRRRARDLAGDRGVGERVDRLASYSLDLLHGKTCEERAEAVPHLRELGDKRAIPALVRARNRKTGGILGLGARRVNGCMKRALDEAIAHLEAR